MLQTSVWILYQCQNVFQRTFWCSIGRTTCATRDKTVFFLQKLKPMYTAHRYRGTDRVESVPRVPWYCHALWRTDAVPYKLIPRVERVRNSISATCQIANICRLSTSTAVTSQFLAMTLFLFVFFCSATLSIFLESFAPVVDCASGCYYNRLCTVQGLK